MDLKMLSLFRNVLIAVVLSGVAIPATAQLSPTSTMRVTLVAGVAPSKGGRTEVVRRAQRAPQNIVIVDLNATADDLAAALATIRAMRAKFGDTFSADLRARPETIRLGVAFKDGAYRKWLHEQLLRLRRAPVTDLADLGRVQSVHITVPVPAASSANGL